MGEIFKLFGTIGLNNKEANEGIDETTGKAKSAGSKIAGFFKKAAIAIGTAFAATKVLGFGKMAVEAAATAKAIQSQFDQVFGNLGTEAQKKVEELGKSFGMLPNRLKQPFAATVSMFKGLGMTTEEAMKQAETSVTAAADAAAFYDVSYESANASLTSFLKGNYEAGESIGIFANDTQMAQYAISQGLVGSTAEWQKLDEATKQATRLEYAKNMQEQAGATGQAALESEGYENQMGNLRQAWQDFLAVVGGPILEPVVAGLMAVSDWLSTAGEKVIELQAWFGELKAEVQDSTAWNTLKEVMQPVIDAFQSMKDSMSNSTFLTDIKNSLTEMKDSMLEIDFVKLSADLQAFIDKWLPLIAGIGAATAAFGLYSLALGIKSGIETIAIISMYAMSAAGGVLAGVMAFLTSPITLVILAIGALVAAGVYLWQNWDTVKAKAIELKDKLVSDFIELKDLVTGALETLKTAALEDFNELMNLGGQAVSTLKTAASEDFNELANIGSSAFEKLKTAAIDDSNELKNGASTIYKTLKNAAISDFTELKTGSVNKFNELKTGAINKFNEMKTSVVNKANELKNGVVNKFNELKNGATEKIRSTVSTIGSKFSEVYDKIMSPINRAKNAVKTAIDTMKGFFNFKWDLPSIKMPKFSVSGSKNPVDWITQGVPKLSVSWHKAGGIFDKATLFNTANGMHGVGEAGPEAILPLNRETLGGIGEGISSTMSWGNEAIIELLEHIQDSLRELLNRNETVVIQVDGRTIAVATRDYIDSELGDKSKNNNFGKGRK
ncbi:hypothetical protein [Carnobacterium jeotgali]|uniref:hypothetical protein n=1 Tax=Carnobacterium jeotgali TaxID=545534 RepID=UPI00068A2672|nr:hypothetical protein [Carnobacterium jeotgali]